jgi:outer membrane protein assembly factor BamB
MRIALLSVVLIILRLGAEDTNWPEFRGPKGNGISAATDLPLAWGEGKNVKWSTPIHGKGWSSPVIWGQQVWLTTATPDGHELFAVCIDRDTGNVIHDLKLFDVAKPQYCHPFNSYASPTPAIETGRIYVTFGAPGTACLDTQTGKVMWTRRDIECNHFRAAGSSPILYSNLFLLNFDGSDRQFVVALDKQTGRTVWQKQRSIDFQDLGPDGQPEQGGDTRKAFATCQIAAFGEQPTLLSQGSRALYAYDPASGAELWRVEERSAYSGATRPVTGHGLVFFPSGFASGQVLAVRPGKQGEVLDAKAPRPPGMQLQVVWKTSRNAPKKPSLLLLEDLLYAIEDNGVATCWEALTGTVVWSERLGGHYSASPLAAGRHIYLFDETGSTTVIPAGRRFGTPCVSMMGDGYMASPAVSGKALFLRSRTQLYRIEK